jgi:heme/copper-type cytochrome/quinol oxidase subunit 2
MPTTESLRRERRGGGPRHVLTGVIDEAWRHRRRRLSRDVILLVLGVAAAITVVAATSGSGSHSRVGNRAKVVAAADRYEVCASNTDDLWRYTYGAGCAATSARNLQPYSYHDLIVPARSKVELAITRAPTTHSLRIPGLGLTLRAGSQSTVETSFRTPRAGETYSGKCLASCGHDRQFTSTNVIAVTPERYKSWLAAQTSAIAQQDKQTGRIRSELIRQGVFAPNAPQ